MIARTRPWWRRILGPTRATTAEIHGLTRIRPALAHDAADPAWPYGTDPGTDPIGTQRYASPSDVFAWVKTDYDRWVHVGGWAVRTDRQVASFTPATMRQHRVDPGPWPRTPHTDGDTR